MLQLYPDSYSEAIISQGILASRTGSEYFLVFQDEVQHLTLEPDLTERWIEIFREIRTVFSGKLSTVIWSNGNLDMFQSRVPSEIISELDVLGIGFFPHITDKLNPTVEELVASYHENVEGLNFVQFMITFSTKVGLVRRRYAFFLESPWP